MPLAEITAEGWVLIILSIFGVSGLGGLITSIITMVLNYKATQRAAERVEAVRIKAVEAADDVHQVKEDLATTKDETHGKLDRLDQKSDRIILVQDGQTERLMRDNAEMARQLANQSGKATDQKKAAAAEAELAAHVQGMVAQNESDKKAGGP